MFKYFFVFGIIGNLFNSEIKAQADCKRTWALDYVYSRLNTKGHISVPLSSIKLGCNFNDSVKTLLLDKISYRTSYKEIDSIILDEIQTNPNLAIEERAQIKKRQTFIDYKKLKDTIFYEEYMNIYNRSKASFKVKSDLVFSVGFLNIKEAIPIFKQGMNEREVFDIEALKLALARLGIFEYANRPIDFVKSGFSTLDLDDPLETYFGIFSNLAYIKSDDAIYNIHNLMDTSTFEYNSKGGEAYCSSMLLEELVRLVENFELEELMKLYNFSRNTVFIVDEKRKELILKVKSWLMVNKGKFKINKYYCPML